LIISWQAGAATCRKMVQTRNSALEALDDSQVAAGVGRRCLGQARSWGGHHRHSR